MRLPSSDSVKLSRKIETKITSRMKFITTNSVQKYSATHFEWVHSWYSNMMLAQLSSVNS